MALQSSGAISLAQIQTEWGGSNPISLSEYYLGSLPTGRTNYGSIPSSGQISMSNFYGTNAALGTWTSTLTVGSFSIFKSTGYGYSSGLVNASAGSMTDDTIDTYNNYQIETLHWNLSNLVNLRLVGSNIPNSGWTSIKVGSTTYNRSSASHNTATSGYTLWQWSDTNNPFGTTTGATRTITFIV